jgi:FtsH-binding integral membrane protein
MADFVFVLCALTSLACTILLLRSYRRERARLLLWCGIAFAGFTLGNILLVVDTTVVPAADLPLLRSVPVLVGLLILIYGLVWETK